jgi:hypothetical protein
LRSNVPFRFHLFRNLFVPEERFGEPFIEMFAAGQAGPSIDKTDEMGALRWIASRPDLLPLLLGQIGFSGAVSVGVSVTEPFLPRYRGGDIDLLAIPEKDPRCTVAFQAKRFKVALTGAGEQVSLEGAKIDDLVRQCNQTVQLGFHQVYGMILVMMDGQNHPAASILHHGASDPTFRRIYHFVKHASLDWRVGIVFVEIVQPTPTNLAEFGMLAVGIDQNAHPLEQCGDFSEKAALLADRLRRKGKVYSIQLPPLYGASIPVQPTEEVGLRLVRRPGSQL